jgi:hypothetical protein
MNHKSISATDKPDTKDLLILSVLMGIITTLCKYSYGVVDQVELLPVVMRAIDNSFLSNDFFTNTSTAFGPRFYYAKFLGMVTTLDTLPIFSWVMTVLINVGTAVITFLLARDFFKSRLAGIVAVSLAMCVSTFGLGYLDAMYSEMLLPSTLAMPFVFLSIWAGFRGHIIIGVTLCGIASIIHILLGFEVASLLLATFVFSEIIVPGPQMSGTKSFKNWRILIFSTLILCLFSSLSLLPELSRQSHISSKSFIDIVAYFRGPHHYLPSTFGWGEYMRAASFMVATGISWYWWQKRSTTSPVEARRVLIFSFTVFLLCLGGYVFVEIFPSRIWTTAQTFRLLYVIKWIGLVLIAGAVTDIIEGTDKLDACLLFVSTLHPLSLGLSFFSKSMRPWVNKVLPFLMVFFEPIVLLLLIVTILVKSSTFSFLLPVYVLLILIVFSWPRKYFYILLSVGIAGFLLLGFLNNNKYAKLPAGLAALYNQPWSSPTSSELGEGGVGVAEYVRQSTPKDGLYLTPPAWGQFRLVANRALVVDFKAFPFQDSAMVEWQQRIFDCYGVPISRGFTAARELDQNYRLITDDKLSALRIKYGIAYAVLYQQTPTSYPIVFENPTFKIITLAGGLRNKE